MEATPEMLDHLVESMWEREELQEELNERHEILQEGIRRARIVSNRGPSRTRYSNGFGKRY